MYKVITWDNDGQRSERPADTLSDALAYARFCRSMRNRTVKVAHAGDAIRHWTRTCGTARNHWSAHATAECSR